MLKVQGRKGPKQRGAGEFGGSLSPLPSVAVLNKYFSAFSLNR